MFNLTDKVALVTGATGGIGRAIALALAERGARVALSGTRQGILTTMATEIGGGAQGFAYDLRTTANAEALAGAVEAAFGRIDILVANAGITRDGLAVRMKDEDWNTVLDVNLTATFFLIRAALKGMMKRRAGRIVAISSVVGVTGNAGQANYAASKAGMIGMCKSLAQEVASRGITVNAIAPGFIVTPMTDGLTDEQKARIITNIPSGRLGAPKDVAAACAYLASDEAAYVTGQTLHVNGGMAMV